MWSGHLIKSAWPETKKVQRVFALALVSQLVLAACSSSPGATPGLAVTAPSMAAGQQGFSHQLLRDYVLRPADVISTRVFREDELSIEAVPISADGQVSFPLVGSIAVAGMTPAQLEARLEQLLGASYLRAPDVAVNVVDYASHQVSVEGAVKEAGLYQFQPGTRLSGGVALAKGLDRVAETQSVVVFRTTAEGTQIAVFDYAAVSSGTMLDPVLQPGDRIVVGTDGLSQFWQDMIKTLPVLALFTNVNF